MTSETELLRELHAEQREMKRRGIIIPFAIHTPDLSVVLALISNLQLALKHPENNGCAAEVARPGYCWALPLTRLVANLMSRTTLREMTFATKAARAGKKRTVLSDRREP